MDWQLYMRPGCHLCDEAEQWLEALAHEFQAQLVCINILDDITVYERYKYKIPVLQIAAQSWYYPFNETTIRNALNSIPNPNQGV
ncbi:glutaredoxin family protein [Herpetosiphon geysericola]|uniref:Glutaredoxin n=1 Tax=Herpetosiphon geysericola TaxID=70996 RepID=A0A0P6XF80_9CHLR|nr:glutaredoxin family protein [Herpetosiphon geysericola]KPL81907.1 hypothetical protein SE18_20100 [Herpetosiphon geysericola]